MKVYFDGRYYDKNISVNDKLYLKNKAPRLFKMVFPSENEKDEREFLQRSEKIYFRELNEQWGEYETY